MLSPQTHEVPPTQCTPERPANVGNTPKRTKMKHGTRPCDLKSQKTEAKSGQAREMSRLPKGASVEA
ncbi:unnamed protein product [Fusarium graminearum]|nr:unnamed protein product [Fusarium graminearum]